MKANRRERARNLLCVLTGVTVIATGACPTIVEAVAGDSSEEIVCSAGVGTVLDVESAEETSEQNTEKVSTEETSEQQTEKVSIEETSEQETDVCEQATSDEATSEQMAEEDSTTEANKEEETSEQEDSEDKQSEGSDEQDTMFNAGAAVVLDTGFTMDEEELDEIMELVTQEQIEETAEEEPEEEDNLVMAKVNEYVNVRESAEQDAEKVGVLYKDCGGTLLEQKDGWSKIESGGVVGWIKDEYLYFGEEAQEVAENVGMLTAVTTTQSLRVRKGPSEDAGVYGLLAYDEAVEVLDEESDWIEINYEGQVGYVSAEYVTISFNIDEAESMAVIEQREREAEEAAARAAEEAAQRNAQKEAVLTTASEADILAALIQCEAGGESYEGQLAVGSVVMNRVRCGGYPNSVTEVIYASGQFGPASTGKMNNLILNGNIKDSCRQAAIEAINGTCNVGDAMHFRRSGSREGYQIGNHVFW